VTSREPDLDVAVVGAGFAGLYMLYRLRRQGLRVRVFEAGADVGGTWYWNRYPGARCDIESVDYCYSFSPELLADWTWTERYATQPEILRYLQHVADRFGLRPDIQFGTRVRSLHYEATGNRWLVRTDAGETVSARYCVLAVGNLSSAKRPGFAGLDNFRGEWYHTARWPAGGVDVQDKRVGIVGTGSTAIQALPQIARHAASVRVFQRTPNYSMPARNRRLPPGELREVVQGYRARRQQAEQSEAGIPIAPPQRSALEVSPAERRRMYEAGWQRGGINALSYAFTDFFTDERANRTAQEFAREKIRQLVRDPAVAEALCPAHHIGTKRTCVDIGYFETYNHDHVELVDVRSAPITTVAPGGLATTAGEYQLDVIVFAIGVLGEFRLSDGQGVPVDPRVALRRQIDRARSQGLEPKAGIEYEFYLFRGDLETLAQSGWRLQPLRTRPYTYGVYGASLDEDLIGEIRRQLAVAGLPVEACNPETGPGQFELNIRYDDALKAADDAFVYKHSIKEIAARHGVMASFMAKPRRDWAGSSCHVHQSLWERDGGPNSFFDHERGHGLSPTGRYYAGGLLATMREFTALFAPTPNSYKRFTPYSWAGTSVSWSYENRSTGIRAIAEQPGQTRLEHRLPGADTNPYIVVAACLAGGLHGIEHKIEPPAACEGDAYATGEFESVPASLEDAVRLLERSTVAREMLGEDFVQHYALMKLFEAEKYRQQVSEWEIRRYVETA
jgi:glutamine synthetase/cation diffusion facilitator CzcD-associated flavoprotein CzcO